MSGAAHRYRAKGPPPSARAGPLQPILGATVHQAKTLTRSGLVPAAKEHHNRKRRYLRVETEALRDALMARADPIRKNLIGLQVIDSAELMRCCTTLELLQLVLDRKLTRVGRANRHGGISSIAVDPMELKSVLLGEIDGWLDASWRQLECIQLLIAMRYQQEFISAPKPAKSIQKRPGERRELAVDHPRPQFYPGHARVFLLLAARRYP